MGKIRRGYEKIEYCTEPSFKADVEPINKPRLEPTNKPGVEPTTEYGKI